MRISDWSSDVCSSDLVRPVEQTAVRRPVPSDGEHLGIDVGNQNLAAGAADGMRLYPFEDPERDVAGSAADVEDRRAGTRIERIDEYRLPEPVDAETHQVVHQEIGRAHV